MAESKDLQKATDMVAEEESRNLSKQLYKLELVFIKVIPIVISIGYFVNTVLTYFCFRIEILSALCGMSLFPLLFIYLSSRVFRFCLRHRLFIYYIGLSELEAWIDYLIGIPVSTDVLFVFDCILFAVLVIYALYLKIKT